MTQVIKDVVQWLQQWFYTEDEIDAMLSDLPTGGGITSITLVPYSQNPNGVICYDGGVAPVVIDVDSVSLTSNKSIISYIGSESATLTATVLDENDNGISDVVVEFFKNASSIGTATTNSNGVATKTYSANGDGDLSITAECESVTSTSINIEDCIYYNDSELSYTSSSTTVSTTIAELGNINNFNFVLEFDIKSNGTGGGLNIGASSHHNPPSGANYREYIGTDSHKFSFNNRTTSSSNTTTGTVTDSTYYHMKLTKTGTSFVGYYGDNNTTIATKNASWISNYTTYNLYWINWSSTNYVKNIKIKKVN